MGFGNVALAMKRWLQSPIFYWLPPIFWAGLIFYLGSLPETPKVLEVPFTDKIAHFALYAILAFLIFRAVKHGHQSSSRFAGVLALILTMGCGAIDEWRQAGIATRTADFHDWLADAVAGSVPFLTCFVGEKLKIRKPGP